MTVSVIVRDMGWGNGSVQILSQISLSLERGETLAVIGPNGGGKTTLLRVLAGLRRDYSGSVELDGHEVRRCSCEELSRRVSLVPQRVEFLPPFTVDEFIGLSGDANHEARQLLLESLGSKRLPHLSGGELQRVMIAGAVAQGASLLLLDEPTASLDPAGRRCVETTLRQCTTDRRFACIVVTHDIGLVTAVADRALIIKDGRVSWSGAPTDPEMTTVLEAAYGCPFLKFPHPTDSRAIIVPD